MRLWNQEVKISFPRGVSGLTLRDICKELRIELLQVEVVQTNDRPPTVECLPVDVWSGTSNWEDT